MVPQPAPLTSRPTGPSEELDRLRQRADELKIAIGNDVLDVRSRVREAFDLRRQIGRHPVIAAALVLGGVLVAAMTVQALLRGVRRPDRKGSRRDRSKKITGTASGPCGRPGMRRARLKEELE